ncbi:hypothetical protein GX48_03631 [Paracoccidioides brasiliensis]|nr:hypothetical protein GX48_03631 [Paracoccidioides brasiliensis]
MEREEVPGALAHFHFQDKKKGGQRSGGAHRNPGHFGMGKEGAEDVNMDNTYATECLENYPGGYGEENEINAVR